jgi:peroxiredoxin Q/BCP
MSDLVPVGTPAPTFQLPSTMGPVDLSAYAGQKNVVLCFYPGDDTPG